MIHGARFLRSEEGGECEDEASDTADEDGDDTSIRDM